MQRIKLWLVALVVLGFAWVGAQLPHLTLNYQRNYNVQLSELRKEVARIEARARMLGETPQEYIERHFILNADPEVSLMGRMLEHHLVRFEQMNQTIAASQRWQDWVQPLYWLNYKDPKIAKETWRSYRFGFTSSWGTLIWAIFGGFLGWFLATCLGSLVRALWNGCKRAGSRIAGLFAAKRENWDIAKRYHGEVDED